MITNLDNSNFQQAIQSSTPILVDFWATWCAPCMMQGEVLHQLDEENPSLQIGKVNVDECRELAVKFGVSAIPTLILFKDGEQVERITGLRQAQQILDIFAKHA